MRTMRVRAAFGLGGSVLAGLFSRGLSEAQPPSPPSLSSIEQRVAALEQQQRHRPVVVCGPSGVGKGTLLGRLMADYPDEFGFSVSHTTRQPRPGEQDGVHYHFVTKEKMEAMSARAFFCARNACHCPPSVRCWLADAGVRRWPAWAMRAVWQLKLAAL